MIFRPIVCAAAVLMASAAVAAELPTRKPGLWEMKMVVDADGVPPQTMQQCTDASIDKEMSTSFGSMQRELCSKQEIRQEGRTIVIESVCQIGPMTMSSRAVISGDFNSAYTMKVASRQTGGPAIPGMSDVATNMTIDAKWAGACKSGQKPGDVMMPGGVKMNIRDMQRMQQGIAPRR